MTQIYSFMVIEVRSLKAPCPSETCREGTFLTSRPALVVPTMLSIIWLEATALRSLFLSSYDVCVCVCVCVSISISFLLCILLFIRILRASWVNQWLESTCQCRRREFDPWVGNIPCRKAATYSSILAWKTPQTEEPGGLQSKGSQRVRHCRTHLTCWPYLGWFHWEILNYIWKDLISK